jgi:hypothetical protein
MEEREVKEKLGKFLKLFTKSVVFGHSKRYFFLIL